ncbi:MAG: hypothetical protein Kow00106_07090 [Anaerolineae bacterium]
MATRKEILQMLAEGTIDVNRAAELLSAAQDELPAAETPAAASPPPEESAASHTVAEPEMTAKPKRGGRWLRIHVSDLRTGRSRVRVNVPLGLVRFGLRIGSRFTDELDEDLARDVIAALEEGAVDGTLVEVEDEEDNERVHIFVD